MHLAPQRARPESVSERTGVYVHVPYCVRRCRHCHFNAYACPEPPWQALCQAVLAELEGLGDLFASWPVVSIYFGGGTPSLAPQWFVGKISQAIRDHVSVVSAPEVSLEANPGTLDREKLEGFLRAGVNRLSVGWQSSQESYLRLLNRPHTAEQGRELIRAAREVGYEKLSVDLIFAFPGQSLPSLERDLDALVDLAPEHISLYALTYYEGTPLWQSREAGEVREVSEALEVEMMERIEERLSASDYARYEVSSYARLGHEAVHNSLYWQGAPYLGLGPGAHSFLRRGWERGWRWEAVRSPRRYCQAWRQDGPHKGLPKSDKGTVSFVEELTPKELLIERMACGLRTTRGVDLGEPVVARYRDKVDKAAKEAQARGWAELRGGVLQPTRQGLLFADSLAGLFV